MHFVTQFTHVLDILELRVENKTIIEKKLFWKWGLRNPLEEPVLSPKAGKDCGHFYFFLHWLLGPGKHIRRKQGQGNQCQTPGVKF